MKNIKSRIERPRKASAQVLGVVIFLLICTAFLVTALDQSLLNIESSRQQAETELSKIRALDSMTKVAAVLVEMVNRSVAIKQDGDLSGNVSAAFEQALQNAGQTVASFDAAVDAASPDQLADLNIGTVSGIDGRFKIFMDDEDIFYRVLCMANCNALLEYPKVFSLEIKEIAKVDKGISTTIKTSAEVQQATLADFSLVAWGETREEVLVGETTQAKVNISFDFDNIVMNGLDDDGNGMVDDELPGRIRFVNPPGTEAYIEQLITNTTVAGLLFGYYYSQGHYGWEQTEVGTVNIPKGVSVGSPQGADIQAAVVELTTSPSTIQGTLTDPQSCVIELGCSSSTSCQISMWETEVGDDTQTPVPVVTDQPIAPNGTYYSRAADGCVIDRHDSNSATDRIYLGSSKATFIADQGFKLRQSLVDHPDLPGPQLGAKVFASLETDALIFDKQTELLNGSLMGAVWDGTASAVDSDEVGFIINAAAIAVDTLTGQDDGAGGQIPPQNFKPFGFAQGMLQPPSSGSSARGSYGILATDGAMMAPAMAFAKLVNTDGDRRVGFENVEAKYSNHWLTNPNELMEQGTSSSHVVFFEGMSATSADLFEALAMVGLEFDDTLGTPPDNQGPTGGGGGGCGHCDGARDDYIVYLDELFDVLK